MLVDDWLELYARDLGPRTRLDYGVVLDRHVLPRLGRLRLRDITPETVARFRADLERVGVGRSTVRRSMVVLQGVLSRGVEWRRISHNPVPAVRKPSNRRLTPVRPFTVEEIEHVRDHLMLVGLTGDATLISVLAYAGLRPQEALALYWDDVAYVACSSGRRTSTVSFTTDRR